MITRSFKSFLAKMTPLFFKIVSRQRSYFVYTLFTISKTLENKNGYGWSKTWNRLLFLCQLRTPHLLRNWYRSFTPVYQMPWQSIQQQECLSSTNKTATPCFKKALSPDRAFCYFNDRQNIKMHRNKRKTKWKQYLGFVSA